MRVIDRGGLGIAFVVSASRRLVGVVSDGDVRRALLKGAGLDEPVAGVMNKSPVSLPFGLAQQRLAWLSADKKIAGRIPREGTMAIPLCDSQGRVKSVFFAHSKEGVVASGKAPGRHQVLKKILVTGGAGYIGSVLVRQLLDKGYSVRVLDKLIYTDDGLKGLENYGEKFEFMRGDVLDVNTLSNAVKGVGAVVHFAEIVGDPATALDAELTVANNIVAAGALAQVCKYYQVNRFVYASSCSVYGSADRDWVDENSELRPVSLYARAKLESEKAVLALADENFQPTILRFATVFGLSPRMRFDLVANVMAADGVTQGRIRVSGGSQWRPLVHVSDVSRAVELCLEKNLGQVGRQVFNVGSDEGNCTILGLAEKIKSALEKSGKKVYLDVATENRDARSYRVSFRKIRDKLGFRPSRSVAGAAAEIAAEFGKGKFGDYRHKKYSNFLSWRSERGRLRRKISAALSKLLPKFA